ncbi:2-dehydropantoate 2-reductase [Evansella sp. AB-rgal1]|uniref:2-dehydropantoate 2-reductase n=1 Tax=Evansella sp. AB-rgal1 TaxID=3242696 RepID=UPI00359EBF35
MTFAKVVNAINIAVIGAGSVGLLISYYLLKMGHEVTIVTKTEKQKDILIREGLFLEKDGKRSRVSPKKVLTHKENYCDVQLWIVTLKQIVLPDFLIRWKEVGGIPPVLFLQNGMGHEELAKQFLSTNVFCGIVTHGARRMDDNLVIHTGVGEMVVGKEQSHIVGKLLDSHPFFSIKQVDDIQYEMKRKLVVNLVVNPLTAIYRIKNGKLLTNSFFYQNARKMFEEGITVLHLSQEEWNYVKEIVEKTRGNYSSMYQDMKKRRNTEIHSITGYVLDLAKKENRELPFITFVHQSIVGLEREYESEWCQ